MLAPEQLRAASLRLSLTLALAACAPPTAGTPPGDAGPAPDAADTSDSSIARPDAHLIDPGRDAGPTEPQGCFAGPLTVAASSSRLGALGITALEDGWLISYVGSDDGTGVTFLDAEGRVRTAHGGSVGQLLRLGPTSFAQIGGHEVQRVDVVDDALIHFAPVTIGIAWGAILTADADMSRGMIRVLSYDPEPGDVSDLRLELTELVLDAASPTGLSARAGRASPSLTLEVGARIAYRHYALRGDMLRVVNDATGLDIHQTLLVQLGLDSLGTGEQVAYRVWERAEWTPSHADYGVAGLTSDWSRMIVTRREPGGEAAFAVETLPGHEPSGALGAIGRGQGFFAVDELLGVIDGDEVRVLSDLDLSVLATLPLSGQFAGAGRRGDDLAVVTKHSDGREISLQVRCVSTRPR